MNVHPDILWDSNLFNLFCTFSMQIAHFILLYMHLLQYFQIIYLLGNY